jgi:hypothetical protein
MYYNLSLQAAWSKNDADHREEEDEWRANWLCG